MDDRRHVDQPRGRARVDLEGSIERAPGGFPDAEIAARAKILVAETAIKVE